MGEFKSKLLDVKGCTIKNNNVGIEEHELHTRCLIKCLKVFTFIGQLQFFYDQAPDAMRSLCSALSLTTVALGNYLSTLLVTIVTKITTRGGKLGWIPDNMNRGHLDYFYWLLAILSFLNFILYLWISKWFTYKKATGHPQRD
ncbi:Proton-dependent oligopeptide transporter family [Populus alba x Populus x berolinensis]|uniref:Proton-dependent oligopeptide transporter family n=1 Tax=Populus alba x Populus x berolinensis TaxID=444605 RepID=A0AAD6LKF8_9ROSI|nr:Proton-dependent oligopeptide transporter family [Populus alba x Populus x berolinensis]